MTNARPPLASFPLRTHEKLRYSDTDRQGHVNHAVFSTLLETGRVEFLYSSEAPFYAAGCTFLNESTRKAHPLTEQTVLRLKALMPSGDGVIDH